MNEQGVYVVSIKTFDIIAFGKLSKYHIDIFRSSSRFDEKEKQFSIDGIVTLDQISQLVRDGYTVEVKAFHPKQGLPASQIINFGEWLKENTDKEEEQKRKKELHFEGGESFPPRGYISAVSMPWVLYILSVRYPQICQLYSLPELSCEGRPIKYIKIAGRTGTNRHGVLFTGGLHARELVNPDILVSLAFDLCRAYREGTGIKYGGKLFSSSLIKQIIDSLDIFIVPLVNPDGREYAMNYEKWWRMNRNPNSGHTCSGPVVDGKGVDINRNFDFLWNSGVFTSTNPCQADQTYKGTTPFSEPETRNVRFLFDNFSHIRFFVDVHSYSEVVGYPWVIDTNQFTDPSMNFQNPLYDGEGIRGSTYSIEDMYSEYIPANEERRYKHIAEKVKDAISVVRGSSYIAIQSALIYNTRFNYPRGVSATSQDYAYSRNYVDPKKRKIIALTLETGKWFNPVTPERTPPFPSPNEKQEIVKEISAGLIEFCFHSLCVVEEAVRDTSLFKELVDMRKFRDEELLNNKAGTEYVSILEQNVGEILSIIKEDENIHSQTVKIIARLNKVIMSSSVSEEKKKKSTRPLVVDANLVKDIEELLQVFKNKASPQLHNAIDKASNDLKYFRNKTLKEGLEAASKEH